MEKVSTQTLWIRFKKIPNIVFKLIKECNINLIFFVLVSVNYYDSITGYEKLHVEILFNTYDQEKVISHKTFIPQVIGNFAKCFMNKCH